jgi:hypothetical protein
LNSTSFLARRFALHRLQVFRFWRKVPEKLYSYSSFPISYGKYRHKVELQEGHRAVGQQESGRNRRRRHENSIHRAVNKINKKIVFVIDSSFLIFPLFTADKTRRCFLGSVLE